MFLSEAPPSSDYLLASLTSSPEAAIDMTWYMYSRMEAARAALQQEGRATDATDRSGRAAVRHSRSARRRLRCMHAYLHAPRCTKGTSTGSGCGVVGG